MSENNTTVLINNNTQVLEKNNILVLNQSMNKSEKWWDRVRTARRAAKLSQTELALRIGCSQGAISKIERGDQEDSALLIKIASECKVSPIWLETGNLGNEYLQENANIDSRVESTLGNYEISNETLQISKVPLFDYIQAGDFAEAFQELSGNEFITTDAKVKKHTYALKVKGDSMEPVLREGMIVIVEPDLSPVPGDYVIAKNGDNEATIKQLIKDGSDWYLKPLNEKYPLKPATNTHVVGVVIQAQLVTKFK